MVIGSYENTDCVAGVNCFFIEGNRNHHINNFESFETVEQYLSSWTFQKAKSFETDFMNDVSILDFIDTLFVE